MSSPSFTVSSISVRKFVLLCSHHLTVYLTILHSFFSVSSRRCGACAAPLRRACTASGLLYYYSLTYVLYFLCQSSSPFFYNKHPLYSPSYYSIFSMPHPIINIFQLLIGISLALWLRSFSYLESNITGNC